MELLEQDEIGERVQIQILSKRGDEVGKWERPHRVDDARDDHERNVDEFG